MFTSFILLRGLAARRCGERGQGLVEYAMILVMVAVVAVGALVILGQTVGEGWYRDIYCDVTTAFGAPDPAC